MLRVDWCERCGWDLAPSEQGLPCWQCWEARADDALVAELAATASDGLAGTRSALSDVADPAGRESFARALSSPDIATQRAGQVARRHAARAGLALTLLSQIDDPDAAAALRRLVEEHTEPRVRAAAVRSLGLSGNEGDAALGVRVLEATETIERIAASAALAELGGPAAADALAQRLELAADEELGHVVA